MTEVLQPVALALRMAYQRHLHARGRGELVEAFASAAETVWWICAIDEHLEITDKSYSQARNRDTNGRYIPGLRWVRDRHTHQVPLTEPELTTDTDETPFFGKPGDNYVVYINPGFTWRATTDIRTNPKKLYGRDTYDKLIAGQKSSAPLYMACRWLQTRIGQDLGV